MQIWISSPLTFEGLALAQKFSSSSRERERETLNYAQPDEAELLH